MHNLPPPPPRTLGFARLPSTGSHTAGICSRGAHRVATATPQPLNSRCFRNQIPPRATRYARSLAPCLCIVFLLLWIGVSVLVISLPWTVLPSREKQSALRGMVELGHVIYLAVVNTLTSRRYFTYHLAGWANRIMADPSDCTLRSCVLKYRGSYIQYAIYKYLCWDQFIFW